MPYRILDLRFCPKRQRIDDEPLQRLLHGHRLITANECFYTHEDVPHLLVSVHYALAHLDAASQPPQAQHTRERDADWKTILRDESAALFETLRTWRSARARLDAVPPYVVLTNAQLAHVANARATNKAQLGEIEGLGPARLDRYADELLQVIATGALPPDFANATAKPTKAKSSARKNGAQKPSESPAEKESPPETRDASTLPGMES